MSKIDKHIQDAREWRHKHAEEALDLSGIDAALLAWETQKKRWEEARTLVDEARKATVDARRAVKAAWVLAKASRKAGSTPT